MNEQAESIENEKRPLKHAPTLVLVQTTLIDAHIVGAGFNDKFETIVFVFAPHESLMYSRRKSQQVGNERNKPENNQN